MIYNRSFIHFVKIVREIYGSGPDLQMTRLDEFSDPDTREQFFHNFKNGVLSDIEVPRNPELKKKLSVIILLKYLDKDSYGK